MHKSATFAPPPSLEAVEVVPNGVGGANIKRSRSQTAPAAAENSGGMDLAATKVQAMFRGRSARAGHGAVAGRVAGEGERVEPAEHARVLARGM